MQDIDYLIIRFFEGRLSDAEYNQLYNLRKENEENESYFKEMEQTWLKATLLDKDRTARGWAIVSSHISESDKKKNVFLYSVVRWACIVILFLTCGSVLLFNSIDGRNPIVNEELLPGTNKAVLYVDGNASDFVVLGEMEGDTILNGASVMSTKEFLDYTMHTNSSDQDTWNRLVTPRGGEYSVRLSDGTTV